MFSIIKSSSGSAVLLSISAFKVIKSKGTTLCLNLSIKSTSLMAHVSNGAGLEPKIPILAPIKPLQAKTTLLNLFKSEINYSSSGK
jgi:hypothetical protein